MATAVKTKAPTGLVIKRNKNTYTLTWKKGDKDYGDGQTCVFRCNNDKFANQAVSAGTTSKSVSVDMTKYYPHTSKMLSRVQFGIRGNRKAYTEKGATIDPMVSDWSYKEFTFNKPSTPSGSTSLSQTHSNVCTFSWSEKVDVASHVHFADCQYQSILVKNCTEAKGDKQRWSTHNAGWMTNTTGATGSITIAEQTELLAVNSYTRWVRVRARGARGASAWRYIKHVYARPNQAKIKTAKVKQTDAGGYLCTVEWVVGAGAAHPIDKVTVQYALAVPMTGMECPDGASWTDASITKDTAGADKAAFSIDTTVGDDQCLFVRVNTEHDTNITYGAAKAATVGYLADPTSLSVVTNPQTHLATVTAENTSDVPDSYLLIRYISADYPQGTAIGIIPHGQTSATVQCPAWASGEAIGFSVQAVVGAYVTSTGADGVTVYTVTEKMRSRNRLTYGGSVPQPPSNVSLAMTDTVGTIQVTFNWAWQDARAAELSWANHADAWQSTDEPDTYVIDNTNASVWNISGLEVGQTWYVRVRLVGGTEDNPTYGGYSDTVSIDLASEPITPVLTLSSGVITDGGTVTASWVYVSTDTTLQAEAHLAEVADTSQLSAEYVETADTTVNTLKAYYVKDGNDYNVIDLGIYSATTDTTVEDGKQYYLRTGSGTASSPYVYTLVASPTGNPQTNGYYEFSGTYSSPSGYYEQNYRIIASTETAQNVTINASEVGWTTGEEHALAVRVVSASGRETGWSEPVVVMVAEPLVCEITQTSLVDETVIVNPQEYSGDVVTFESDAEPVVRELTVTLTPKQSGSGDPLPTNVRPISGYDSVTVTRTGKNLLPYPYYNTTKTTNGITFTDNGDGTVTANGTATANAIFTIWDRLQGTGMFVDNGNYIMTGCPDGGGISTYRIYVNHTVNGSGVSYGNDYGNGMEFTVDEDNTRIGMGITIYSGATVSNLTFKPMLRLASETDATYEPYTGNTYPVALPQTVYGGELDVVSGELTIDTRYLVIDGSESWSALNRGYRMALNTLDRGVAYSLKECGSWLRGAGYIPGQPNPTGSSGVSYTFTAGSYLNINVADVTEITDVASLKTYLSSHNLQICYELATPQTYTLTPRQVTALLGQNVIWNDGTSVTVKIADDVQQLTSLKEMPLTVTVTGAGKGGTTTVAIERLSAYHVTRPDEVDLYGFEGETVALMSQMGEAQMTIGLTDLIGRLDDGAQYRLTATITDGLGQRAEQTIDFWVNWDHQAIIPNGTVTIDTWHLAAMLVPVAPTGTAQGDACDIYRLSVDRPQLIYADAAFGQTYVDPYPTLGSYGGYRFVFKSKEGDYITADNEMAWTDIQTDIDHDANIIDFGTGRVELEYNVDVSNAWSKDFKETKYLGGSIQGDWNPAVSRTSSVGAVAIVAEDPQTIEAVRRLAVYPGLCHIRTKEGSSYPADVQISESYAVSNGHKIADFSLKITRVDSEELDGMTLAEWQASHQEE